MKETKGAGKKGRPRHDGAPAKEGAWEPWMLEDLARNWASKPPDTLAERYGKRPGAVACRAWKMGLRKRPGRKPRHAWTQGELDTVAALYPDRPTAEIAALLGLRVTQVAGKANWLGLRKSEAYTAALPARRGAKRAAACAEKRSRENLNIKP